MSVDYDKYSSFENILYQLTEKFIEYSTSSDLYSVTLNTISKLDENIYSKEFKENITELLIPKIPETISDIFHFIAKLENLKATASDIDFINGVINTIKNNNQYYSKLSIIYLLPIILKFKDKGNKEIVNREILRLHNILINLSNSRQASIIYNLSTLLEKKSKEYTRPLNIKDYIDYIEYIVSQKYNDKEISSLSYIFFKLYATSIVNKKYRFSSIAEMFPLLNKFNYLLKRRKNKYREGDDIEKQKYLFEILYCLCNFSHKGEFVFSESEIEEMGTLLLNGAKNKEIYKIYTEVEYVLYRASRILTTEFKKDIVKIIINNDLFDYHTIQCLIEQKISGEILFSDDEVIQIIKKINSLKRKEGGNNTLEIHYVLDTLCTYKDKHKNIFFTKDDVKKIVNLVIHKKLLYDTEIDKNGEIVKNLNGLYLFTNDLLNYNKKLKSDYFSKEELMNLIIEYINTCKHSKSYQYGIIKEAILDLCFGTTRKNNIKRDLNYSQVMYLIKFLSHISNIMTNLKSVSWDTEKFKDVSDSLCSLIREKIIDTDKLVNFLNSLTKYNLTKINLTDINKLFISIKIANNQKYNIDEAINMFYYFFELHKNAFYLINLEFINFDFFQDCFTNNIPINYIKEYINFLITTIRNNKDIYADNDIPLVLNIRNLRNYFIDCYEIFFNQNGDVDFNFIKKYLMIYFDLKLIYEYNAMEEYNNLFKNLLVNTKDFDFSFNTLREYILKNGSNTEGISGLNMMFSVFGFKVGLPESKGKFIMFV